MTTHIENNTGMLFVFTKSKDSIVVAVHDQEGSRIKISISATEAIELIEHLKSSLRVLELRQDKDSVIYR